MKYYGLLPERKAWVKIGALILGALAAYQAYINGRWFYLPFGLVLILVSFSDRRQVVSKDGVDIEYRLLGQTYHNLWTYDEIMAVHTDKRKSAPNIELHFNKGVINRRFIFKKEDAQSIIYALGQLKPGLDIKEVNQKNKNN